MSMNSFLRTSHHFLCYATKHPWRKNIGLSFKKFSRSFLASPLQIFPVEHVSTFYPLFIPLICVPCHNLANRNDEEQLEIEDNITHLIILAKLALEKGDKDRAEAILEMGLKICQERDITFGLPFMYDILTTIALSNGDIDKAEKLLVTIIEKMSKSGTAENNHHIVDFKLRLARIYSAYREYELAEIGFKNCLNSQKQKILAGDVSTKTGMLYVNVLFWYGIHKIRNNHYNGAKKLLDTAYDYSSKIKGLSPYQEMVILYTLADLNMELGELNVALTNMQNAVMLGKGIGSTDLPRCYVKLAKIYVKMNVLDQARSAVDEGIKLAELFNFIDILQDGQSILKEINDKQVISDLSSKPLMNSGHSTESSEYKSLEN